MKRNVILRKAIMKAEASSNQDLSFPAAVFTLCLCTLFGANAVAIKISLSGLGVFTTAGLRFGMPRLRYSFGPESPVVRFISKRNRFTSC